MATLTQAEFEVKLEAKFAELKKAYASELAAKVERDGFSSVDHFMGLCSTNEPAVPFAEGDCSDEAIEFIADSIVGALEY